MQDDQQYNIFLLDKLWGKDKIDLKILELYFWMPFANRLGIVYGALV